VDVDVELEASVMVMRVIVVVERGSELEIDGSLEVVMVTEGCSSAGMGVTFSVIVMADSAAWVRSLEGGMTSCALMTPELKRMRRQSKRRCMMTMLNENSTRKSGKEQGRREVCQRRW
jgi:hypothetical protein